MPKKLGKKIKIAPIKPKEAERRLFKNGFKFLKSEGADRYYVKMNNEKPVKDKDGKEIVSFVSFHPKELGRPITKLIIKKARKTNEEWVNL